MAQIQYIIGFIVGASVVTLGRKHWLLALIVILAGGVIAALIAEFGRGTRR